MKVAIISNNKNILLNGSTKILQPFSFKGKQGNDKFEHKSTPALDPIKYFNDVFPDAKKFEIYLKNFYSAILNGDKNSQEILRLIEFARNNNIDSDIFMQLVNKPQVNRGILEEMNNKESQIRIYTNQNEALEKSCVGDVFLVNGDKFISMKNSKGDIIRLEIEPNMYLALFPSVKKYITTQNFSSDCYLLAVLCALINKPEGKEKILSSIKQDGEDVLIKFNSGCSEYRYNCAQLPSDVDNLRLAKGCLGIKMFEYAYGLELEQQTKVNSNQIDLDKVNTSLPSYYPKYKSSADYYRDKSGSTLRFMKSMGIFGKSCNLAVPISREIALSTLSNPNNFVNKIFIGVSKKTPKLAKNQENHGYVIEPQYNSNKLTYRVYDSSNSSFYTIMDLDELMECFSHILIGDIN